MLFVPEIARLSWLVDLPEGEDLGANIDLAMDAIEATNTGLRGVLPRGYQKLEKSDARSSSSASSRRSRARSPATPSG